jgi:hypothetical protein
MSQYKYFKSDIIEIDPHNTYKNKKLTESNYKSIYRFYFC